MLLKMRTCRSRSKYMVSDIAKRSIRASASSAGGLMAYSSAPLSSISWKENFPGAPRSSSFQFAWTSVTWRTFICCSVCCSAAGLSDIEVLLLYLGRIRRVEGLGSALRRLPFYTMSLGMRTLFPRSKYTVPVLSKSFSMTLVSSAVGRRTYSSAPSSRINCTVKEPRSPRSCSVHEACTSVTRRTWICCSMFCSATEPSFLLALRVVASFVPVRSRSKPRACYLRWRQSELVYLSGEDEVALGETVYFVREDRNFSVSPAEAHVGVVPLLLGELAHSVDEAQSLPEVLEPEAAAQVMLLDYLPLGNLPPEIVEFLSFQRRRPTPARHAR